MESPGPVRLGESIALAEIRGITEYPLGAEVPVNIKGLRDALRSDTISETEPFLASGYHSPTRTLFVLPEHATGVNEVVIERIHWIEAGPHTPNTGISVQVLSPGLFSNSMRRVEGQLFFHLEKKGRIIFKSPMTQVYSGSPLVFCDGKRILGSGWVA
jgi:tRNA U34 2-thiouridine synthase MnmA/TrmU